MRLQTALAAVAVIAGLGLVEASPASAEGGCASTCSVGGAGTGGENSNGNAEGFRIKKPSTTYPDSTYTNTGNQIGGRISVTGTVNGVAAGAYMPQGFLVGHFNGVLADYFGMDGPCNGVCG